MAEGVKPGERVELHPATDAWMQGDRYGTVETVGRRWITVLMDKSERRLRLVRELLQPIDRA